MDTDIAPRHCGQCKHWRPLEPGEQYYNPEADGILGKCENPEPNPAIAQWGLVTGALGSCTKFEAGTRPAVRPICQTCAFWTRHTMTLIGDCANPKLVFTGQGAQIPIDGLGCYVTERARSFQTDETFGCVHHQPRT